MWTDDPLPFPNGASAAHAPADLHGPLGFGRLIAPWAVTADHAPETGFGPITLVDRSAPVLPFLAGAVQYGFSVFEGLKAHRSSDGSLHLFRPEAHAARFRASAERLCLPEIDTRDFLAAMAATVRANEAWVPPHAQGALYLRPTLLAGEEAIGFRSPGHCRLFIAASPAGPMSETPMTLWVEREFSRAAAGGVGSAKTGANYAASLFATQRARLRGYDNVLWLDAQERRFLGEGGTMNVFVAIAGRVVTPPLDGTILAGITRDTCIALLRDHDVCVEERPIALEEVQAAAANGELQEVWCSGTAIGVATVRLVGTAAGDLHPVGGDLARRLRGWLADAQCGSGPDPNGYRRPLGAPALH